MGAYKRNFPAGFIALGVLLLIAAAGILRAWTGQGTQLRAIAVDLVSLQDVSRDLQFSADSLALRTLAVPTGAGAKRADDLIERLSTAKEKFDAHQQRVPGSVRAEEALDQAYIEFAALGATLLTQSMGKQTDAADLGRLLGLREALAVSLSNDLDARVRQAQQSAEGARIPTLTLYLALLALTVALVLAAVLAKRSSMAHVRSAGTSTPSAQRTVPEAGFSAVSLAGFGHDLRNALHVIKNALQILYFARNDPAANAEAAQVIERQVRQLGDLLRALEAGDATRREAAPPQTGRPPGAGAAAIQRPVATAGARHRILVVEDHQDSAKCLATRLKSSGYEVRTAADGPEALALAETFQPEAVLLDIGLPGMDGFEVARRLRQKASGAESMLIAVTGWNDEASRARTRAAGFNHHLVKPIEFSALNALLGGSPAPTGGSPQGTAVRDAASPPDQRG